MHYIYVLKDPRTMSVKYVGVSNNPMNRYTQHMNGLSSGEVLTNWIRGLRSQGERPVMDVIDFTEDRKVAERMEWSLILMFRGCGIKNGSQLLNNRSRQYDIYTEDF